MKNNKHYDSFSNDYCEYDNENYLRKQHDKNKNKRIRKNKSLKNNMRKNDQKKQTRYYNGDDED